MNFSDLDFEPRLGLSGFQALVFSSNGYGASVIGGASDKGYFAGTLTSAEKPYELAVLRGREDSWELCFSTPIADGPLGYLTEEDVERVLWLIDMLPEVTV